MKVEFLRHIVIGDNTYKPGDVAEVDASADLISSGKARAVRSVTQLPDDYRELQALAKARGIAANQSKANLIEALSE